ncbi:MAG: hypothetical protein KDB23_07315 [Planctomycetales bacterium]|nr:hypothetical protein [Planctomycetales bacterium]
MLGLTFYCRLRGYSLAGKDDNYNRWYNELMQRRRDRWYTIYGAGIYVEHGSRRRH